MNKLKNELKDVEKNGTDEEKKIAKQKYEQAIKNVKESETVVLGKKNDVKKQESQLLNQSTKVAQMSHADYDNNNKGFSDFKNLISDGGIQGLYKYINNIVQEVVFVVKIFFYFLYSKSMMTLLPFIMTMSFSFSFIRYLFQNVRNAQSINNLYIH